jgi:hypothetical protein
MEELLAQIETEPLLTESREEGFFPAPYDRFSYMWEITKVEVPQPPLPNDIPEAERNQLRQQFQGYMPKIHIEIGWTRAGLERERVGETLLQPGRLWLPPQGPPQ